MLGETERASPGRWCWPRARASSGQATGRAPPAPWGGGRRRAPGTPSPTGTAESPDFLEEKSFVFVRIDAGEEVIA